MGVLSAGLGRRASIEFHETRGVHEPNVKAIGKYQVHRVLGRGGMGTVYEAQDPLLHRKVAIKTMIPGLAESPDLRVRFLREAQAAGRLRHRNIVTVYDVGEDQGQPYITMEFIEGSDLEKVIEAREPRSLDWKLEVLRQICDGLDHAHRAGIVHRDVKPANIRVTPDGEVKIMDFGIAHLQSSTMTKDGVVLGTVHYMAPELIEGHRVDHRADVFSVAAIAYELITYRKPFEGDSPTTVMFKIMHERADPAAFPPGGSSEDLVRIVMKGLARDFTERYQSLSEMQADLEAFARRHARDKKLEVSRGDAPPRGPAARPHSVTSDAQRAEMRAEMERARNEGQLQLALRLAHRLLEADPDDSVVARSAARIQAAIQDGEVDQLCSLALKYAAENDHALALKIADKVRKMAPESARYQELQVRLDEARQRRAQELIEAAQDHLAEGELEAAHRTAEEALHASPGHSIAREIRDRSAKILALSAKSALAGPPTSTTALSTPPPVSDLTPPSEDAAPPEAAAPDVPPLDLRFDPSVTSAEFRPSSLADPLRRVAAAVKRSMESPGELRTPPPFAPPESLTRQLSALLDEPSAELPKPTATEAPNQAPPPETPTGPLSALLKESPSPVEPSVPSISPVDSAPGPKAQAAGGPAESPASLLSELQAALSEPRASVTPESASLLVPEVSPALAAEPSDLPAPEPPAVPSESPNSVLDSPSIQPAEATPPSPLEGSAVSPSSESNPHSMARSAREAAVENATSQSAVSETAADKSAVTETAAMKTPDPGHADSARREAAALTAAALDHFVKNEPAKARKAVQRALALEPRNRKARELARILGLAG
jgi:tetratricopeptide (TPR) repeat protein/predicted Ser/Thr protein kinase